MLYIFAALILCFAAQDSFCHQEARNCHPEALAEGYGFFAGAQNERLESQDYASPQAEYTDCAINASNAANYRSHRNETSFASARKLSHERRGNSQILNTSSFAKSGKWATVPEIIGICSAHILFGAGHDEFIRFRNIII